MNFESLLLCLRIFLVSVLGCGLLGLFGIYIFFKWRFMYWRNQNIRVTNPVFPLGDISQVGFFKNIGIVLKEIYDRFEGERFNGMWTFYRPCIMIRDPELIKVICVRDFNYFRDRGLYYNEKADPLSANLFFIRGTKWRNLRAALSTNFSSNKMKKMFNIMSEKGSKLQEILQIPAENNLTIQLKEYAIKYTHEIAASCLLGLQTDCINTPKPIFCKMGKHIFDSSWMAIIRMGFSTFAPALAYLFQINAVPRPVTDFFLDIVKDVMVFRKVENSGDHKTDANDFMQLLIKLTNQGYLENVDSKKVNKNDCDKKTGKLRFTFENAVAQAFIFWMGAFETSATTMQFALYEMALNENIQKKAREEIQRVLMSFNGKITYESVLKMEYLGRLLDETLRKYPPVPLLTRVCLKDYKVPDSELVIEKGVSILISVLGLHMDPKFYPNPEKFDPERFSEEEKRKRHRYVYLPFGEGPHQCIGQRYALMQMKVGLATLLANYKFEATSATPKKLNFCRKTIVYSVKNGIPLKITKLTD